MTTVAQALDRLRTARATRAGDTAPWETHLGEVDRDSLLRAAIEVVRRLLLPGFEAQHPGDRRPHGALQATEQWMRRRTDDAVRHAQAKAKACTAARRATLGYGHRVAEAARAIATAPGARTRAPLFEALAFAEEELEYRLHVAGDYARVPEAHRAIVEVLAEVLLA